MSVKKVVKQHNKRDLIVHTPLLQRPQKVIIQNYKRQIETTTLINKIKSFISSNDSNYYLGFGGLGDALLLLATCWNDPKAKVIFFANQQPFIRQFFDLFNVQIFLHDNVMGSNLAPQAYNLITKHPNFKQSAHLADYCNYEDWRNEEKYIKRIISYVPWIEKLGKKEEETIILSPSGSQKCNHRQRHLSKDEFEKLVNKHEDIYAIGSLNDIHYYGLIKRKGFHWLNSDKIYHWDESIEKITIKDMVQIIHSAKQVISMDTWLKTYSLLCGIPTTVIETRWYGQYYPYGGDSTDWVFLNPKIWKNITFAKITDLI